MPPHQAHLAKAKENAALYETLTTLPADWQAVVLFYSAVHYVETLCDVLGHGHNTVHTERDSYVMNKHPALWPPYKRLKNESVKARYLTMSQAKGGNDWKKSCFSMTPQTVASELVPKLDEIVRAVEARLPAIAVRPPSVASSTALPQPSSQSPNR